jgi:hypothetical protein
MAHQLGHHLGGLHDTREESETIAESVAYVTLAHFGLDSGARSFPYVALWAQDRATFKKMLGTIQAVSTRIIQGVEGPGPGNELPPVPGGASSRIYRDGRSITASVKP